METSKRDAHTDAVVKKLLASDPKFACLERYLKKWNLRELASVSVDDIVAVALPEDKLAMRLFARDLTASIAATFSATESLSPVAAAVLAKRSAVSPIAGAAQPHIGYLDWRGRLIGCALQGFRSKATQVLLSELHESKELLELHDRPLYVDCSANSLVAADVPTIYAALMPYRCEVVDLSRNRIDALADDADVLVSTLLTWLESDALRYLDITVNPFVSIDSLFFFGKLSKHHLTKLIWVSKPHVAQKQWDVMVSKTPSLVEAVVAAHNSYYQLYGGSI